MIWHYKWFGLQNGHAALPVISSTQTKKTKSFNETGMREIEIKRTINAKKNTRYVTAWFVFVRFSARDAASYKWHLWRVQTTQRPNLQILAAILFRILIHGFCRVRQVAIVGERLCCTSTDFVVLNVNDKYCLIFILLFCRRKCYR